MRCPTLVQVLALTLLSVYPASAQDWSATFAATAPGLAQLESLSEDHEDGGKCSTVILNTKDRIVVTAAHCVLPGTGASYAIGGKNGTVLKVNRLLDLAVFKVDKLPRRAVAIQLADDMPGAGTPVAVIGYGLGSKDIAPQFGAVTNPHERESGDAWVNVEILPGDSGGAVVDVAGHLVGIAVAVRFNGPSRIGIIVPLDTVRDFVEDYLPKRVAP